MIPAFIKEIDEDLFFIRARKNEPAGKLFNKRKELKYPPAKFASLMRANKKEQPMFYTSYITDIKTHTDAVLTILYETSPFVRSLDDIGILETTISIWKNKRKLNVLILPTFDVYETIPEEFERCNQFWDIEINKKTISLDELDYMKNIIRNFAFISQNELEQDKAYEITSDFTQKVFECNPDIDGIMYPSARLNSVGIQVGTNVVFKPNICDMYFNLVKVYIAHFFKPNIKQEFITYFSESIVCSNIGKIKYKICSDYFDDVKMQGSKTTPPINYLSLKLRYDLK